MRLITTRLSLFLLCVWLFGLPAPVYSDADHPTVINLQPDGPQPKVVRVAPGTEVHWVSHLNLMVVTLVFLDGQRVAQATTVVAGYNGFVLEGQHFVGRMEGRGGKVALRFITPGEYIYSLDHHEYITGTIVVQQ
ncbi:MAG TPA: hypothetical protein VI542_34825 [Candidatus Tectomicrobia bacterium]